MIDTKKLNPIDVNDLIRLGRPNDGGYVVTKKILSISDGLLSYGINKDWSFEKDFWKQKPESIIHCYDHSVSLVNLIIFTFKSVFLSIIRLLLFDKKRLAKEFLGIFVIPDYYYFFQNKRVYFKNRIWNNNKNNSKTFQDTLTKIYSFGAKNVFLKMDIETAEYKVLNDVLKTKNNIVGMAIEFHKIDEYASEFNSLVSSFLKDFHIVHVHGNNYVKLIQLNNCLKLKTNYIIIKNYK